MIESTTDRVPPSTPTDEAGAPLPGVVVTDATTDQPEVVACCAPLSSQLLTEPDAETLARQFAALSDPVRLRLVSLLAGQIAPQ